MYYQFNTLINKYDNLNFDDELYWYEIDIFKAMDIIQEFDNSDWELLISNLKYKSNIWKERLVNCIFDSNNIYQQKVILELLKIDDINLFVAIISTINARNISFSNETNQMILKRIDFYMNKVDSFDQRLFDKYKEKNIEVSEKLYYNELIDDNYKKNINDNYYQKHQIPEKQEDIKKNI